MALKKKKSNTKKESKEEYLEVKSDEVWLQNACGRGIYNTDFLRIIDFYVLHSPCRVSSYSPRSLEKLGWKNPWQSSIFRTEFDRVPGFCEGDTFRFHESKNHFLEMWKAMGVEDFFGVKKEFAVFTHAGETNPRMDLLHHIRNSFAHGRFACKRFNKQLYIYFEDVTDIRGIKGLFVTARICLKITTLSEWLDIFEKKSKTAEKMKSLYSSKGRDFIT